MQLNTAIRRSIGAVLAAAIIVMALSTANDNASYPIAAEFPKVPGLYVGNEVIVLGVTVGKITSIEPRGTRVRVTMEIDDDIKVPAGADAVLLPRSIVTDRVIELTPAYTGGAAMQDGAEIPITRSHVPVEFQDVVKAVDVLSAELGRLEEGSGAIEDFLNVAADNAHGNGARLRDTLNGVQSVVAGFSRERGNVVELVRQLAKLVEEMAKGDDTVRSFAHTLTDATDMLNGEGKDLNAALRELLAALEDVAGFVTSQRNALRGGIEDVGSASTVFGQTSTDLVELVDTLGLLMQNAERMVDVPTKKVRAHLEVDETILGTEMFAGFCTAFTQLPLCALADLRP